jgi:hypothetical protein
MKKYLNFIFCLMVIGTFSDLALANVDECLDIKASMDRLACYDREAGYNPVVRTLQEQGKWQVHTKTSKIDDSTNVFFIARK